MGQLHHGVVSVHPSQSGQIRVIQSYLYVCKHRGHMISQVPLSWSSRLVCHFLEQVVDFHTLLAKQRACSSGCCCALRGPRWVGLGCKFAAALTAGYEATLALI